MKMRIRNVMLGAILFVLLATSIGHADLNDGLVAYYPFNGNANDETENGNDGTVYGATPTNDRYGNLDSAYHFEGFNNDDYIDVGHDPSLTPDVFTVSAWFKTSNSDEDYHVIFGLSYGGYSSPQYDIRIMDNMLVLQVRNYFLYGGDKFQFIPTVVSGSYEQTVVTDGSWHHVVATRSGSVAEIYLDGVLESSSSLMPSGPVSGREPALPYYIGAVYENGLTCAYEFDGSIDEVRLYNRGLECSEIQQLAGTEEPSLVAYWSFDDETDPGNDDSGNGNHGTVVGAIPTSGIAGNALWFDGTDDYMLVPDDDTLDLGWTGTICAFMKLEPDFTTRVGIVTKAIGGNAAEVSYELTYVWEDPGPWGEGITAYLHDGASNVEIPKYEVDLRGEWHHIAMTWDGTVARIYCDGEIVGSTPQTTYAMKSTFDVHIGRHKYWGSWYSMDGILDEVRMYNYALSQSEIEELATPPEPTPEEQIEEILDFVDDSVIDGTLEGIGPGKSADNKLNALINQLEQVQSYIEDGLFSEACLQMQDIYKKCDGQSPPPDTVTGNAATELAEKIEHLMESLSCPPPSDLGFTDDFVDTWLDKYSQNGMWMKSGDWEVLANNTYLRQENVSVSDSKLILTVPSNKYEGAQIESLSHDFHYGYYEAKIRASAEPGVVNAFFMWSPKDNHNEIDIEFLSKEFGTGTSWVHFVLHPHEGLPVNKYHYTVELDFNPADSFNIYGFDWSASYVDFYVNGERKARMLASEGFPVPSQPGAIMLSNWTGGLINWGGGPPSNSTTMEVDWVSFSPESD